MDFLHFKGNEEDFVPLSQDFFFFLGTVILYSLTFIIRMDKVGGRREEKREHKSLFFFFFCIF